MGLTETEELAEWKKASRTSGSEGEQRKTCQGRSEKVSAAGEQGRPQDFQAAGVGKSAEKQQEGQGQKVLEL